MGAVRNKRVGIGLLGVLGLLVTSCSSSPTASSSSSSTNQAGAAATSGSSGPTLARIKATGQLRDCVDPEFPPEISKDASGNVVGLDIDLAQNMAKALNAKLVLVPTDFAGLLAGLEANKCDIEFSGTTPRAARALAITFAQDYLVLTVGVVLPVGYPNTTMAQLNQPSVKFCDQEGTLAQFAQETYFPKATALNLTSAPDCFLQVESGKANVTITDSGQAYAITKAHPNLTTALFDNGGLAASPSAPGVQLGDYGFQNWVNVWLGEVIDNGDYTPIYKKWFGQNPDLQELLIQRGGD